MDAFFSLMHGFEVLLTPMNVGYMVVGILFGVLLGFLPGVGGANGIAILLPLTFSMPNTTAIIMLAAIYWGALFGGCISAILFNIPGEPWSVATTFDGHPLAKQGRAGEALTASLSLVLHRRADCDHHADLHGADRRQFRARFRSAGILLGLPADLLQLRRHGPAIAVQGHLER